MPPPTHSPSEEYKQRQQTREAQVEHFEKLHRRFGNIRLLVVVATVIAAWFSAHREAFSSWWLLLALLLFLLIAALHAKVLRKRACAEKEKIRRRRSERADIFPAVLCMAALGDFALHRRDIALSRP